MVGSTCKNLLLKSYVVRGWSNENKVCGSSKVKTLQFCLPQYIICIWKLWKSNWLFTLPFTMHLTIYFSFALLLLRKCNCHLHIVFFIHLAFIYCFTLLHEINSPLDFSSSSLHLPLENSCHIGFTFIFGPAT